MDIFEASEVYPHRTVQQEDEQQAQPSASANLLPPLILWNGALRQGLYPRGMDPQLLVIATSKVSCALLSHAFPQKQILGTCILPEVQMRGNHVRPSLRDRTCLLYCLPGDGQLVLACCQYDVPPERAVAVTRGLLKELSPKHVVVLGSVGSEQLRSGDSEQDPSQEALVFLLSTAAAKTGSAQGQEQQQQQQQQQQPRQQQPVPHLPSGSIASGLPAAILSYCQARAISAELLVTIDMVPSLLPLALQPLAAAASALMSRRAAGHVQLQEAVRGLTASAALKSAGAELQRAYGGANQGIEAVYV